MTTRIPTPNDENTAKYTCEWCGESCDTPLQGKRCPECKSLGLIPSIQQVRGELLLLKEKQEQYTHIANYIIKTQEIKSDNYTKDCLMFGEVEGIYIPEAEVKIREIIHRINPNTSSKGKTEIIDKIKILTPHSIYDFDKEDIVACKNGVMNLETKKIHPFSSDFNLTRKINAKYDPEANDELLNQFMNDITDCNQDMIDTFYEILADCLNNHYRSQKLHMFVGRGLNGKGTLTRLFTEFLGHTNVSGLSLYQLSANFMTARLFGKLANISGDISTKKITYTGIIKKIRGEDYIEADRKHVNPLKFRNTAKGIFCCQEVPTSDDESDAWARSWLIYNFNRRFSISDFEIRLITPETLSALFNKVLIAIERLRKNQLHFTWEKFTPTIEQQRVRLDFASNNVKAFYQYACDFSSGNEVPKADVKAHYEKFCEMFDMVKKGERQFAKDLKAYAKSLGSRRPRGPDGKQIPVWVNISLSELSELSESFSFCGKVIGSTLHKEKTSTQSTQSTQKQNINNSSEVFN